MLNQAYVFFIFIFTGLILGILFDLFRILRKSFDTNDFFTYIEDIIFWILSGTIILYSLFKFNNGEIRFFVFMGIVLGLLLYFLTFSKIFVEISVYIILFVKKMLYYIILLPIKYLAKFFKKIVFSPTMFIFLNFRKHLKKMHIFGKKSKYKKDLSKEC